MNQTAISPMRAVRERHGLARNQMAFALGISYGRLEALEAGRHPTLGAAHEALKQMGEDPAAITEAMNVWRATQGELARNAGKAGVTSSDQSKKLDTCS